MKHTAMNHDMNKVTHDSILFLTQHHYNPIHTNTLIYDLPCVTNSDYGGGRGGDRWWRRWTCLNQTKSYLWPFTLNRISTHIQGFLHDKVVVVS